MGNNSFVGSPIEGSLDSILGDSPEKLIEAESSESSRPLLSQHQLHPSMRTTMKVPKLCKTRCGPS